MPAGVAGGQLWPACREVSDGPSDEHTGHRDPGGAASLGHHNAVIFGAGLMQQTCWGRGQSCGRMGTQTQSLGGTQGRWEMDGAPELRTQQDTACCQADPKRMREACGPRSVSSQDQTHR